MNNFSFSTVPHLISEIGASKVLGTHIVARFPNVRRVMIVTDPGFLRTGLVDVAALSLQQSNLKVTVYSDVVADPPESFVLAAVNFARMHDAELIIGLGGGSSMDVAKLIA